MFIKDDTPGARGPLLERFPAGVRIFTSTNALDTVWKDQQKAVRCAERGNLRPNPIQQGMEITHPHVTDTQMNDARRWLTEHGECREVGILGDDGQFLALGVFPDLQIGPGIVEIEDIMIFGTSPKGKPIRQIGVDQKTCHLRQPGKG